MAVAQHCSSCTRAAACSFDRLAEHPNQPPVAHTASICVQVASHPPPRGLADRRLRRFSNSLRNPSHCGAGAAAAHLAPLPPVRLDHAEGLPPAEPPGLRAARRHHAAAYRVCGAPPSPLLWRVGLGHYCLHSCCTLWHALETLPRVCAAITRLPVTIVMAACVAGQAVPNLMWLSADWTAPTCRA